jgi:CheY-like chemotaxis protein
MATILIVEDEEPIREIVALVLRDAGHRTFQATHGAQALELVAEEHPDLVISDIMMPVLSGGELCRRLKAEPKTRSIPVILMSAAGCKTADGTGRDAFLAKPFELDELEALVQRWLPYDSHQDEPTG